MTKTMKPNRLRQAINETADDMRRLGVMSTDTHEKITLREVGDSPALAPMSGEDIRSLREKARLSQAVLARRLGLSVGYISQLERGAKRPSGPALVLLDLIRRKGVGAIL